MQVAYLIVAATLRRALAYAIDYDVVLRAGIAVIARLRARAALYGCALAHQSIADIIFRAGVAVITGRGSFSIPFKESRGKILAVAVHAPVYCAIIAVITIWIEVSNIAAATRN
jgi:hypothetical protein